ncbi:MAG: pyruvate synthase [Chloroflexi bacterium]|nr:pyruvate synthase [Chloroflexota bacterium]
MLLSGNEATAHAARLARIEVFPVYPITPQAPMINSIVGFIDRGELKCAHKRMESDHSALAGAAGASLVGARAFTASNSQGLALMHELLFYTAGLRLPVVMAIINRALSAPHCRFPDHSDAIAQEATGWLQLYCENNQEVLDTVLQAFRIAEDERVLLPVMVNFEGYILGHTKEVVEVPEQEAVDAFLPAYSRAVVDVEHPAAINTATNGEIYMEYKYLQHRAMQGSLTVVKEVNAEFAERFGRDWGGAVELYRGEDARALLVAMGSAVSTARIAVDEMRAAGQPVGLLKVRSFRPFPADEIRSVAAGVRALAVIDRDIIYGVGGALHREVQWALAGDAVHKPVLSYIAGMGGRDISVADVKAIGQDVLAATEKGSVPMGAHWVGLKADLVGEAK